MNKSLDKVILTLNNKSNNYTMCKNVLMNGDILVYHEKDKTVQTNDIYNVGSKIVICYQYKNLLELDVNKFLSSKKIIFADVCKYKFDNFIEFKNFIEKFETIVKSYSYIQIVSSRENFDSIYNRLVLNKNNEKQIYKDLYKDASFEEMFNYISTKIQYQLDSESLLTFAFYIYYKVFYQKDKVWQVIF